MQPSSSGLSGSKKPKSLQGAKQDTQWRLEPGTPSPAHPASWRGISTETRWPEYQRSRSLLQRTRTNSQVSPSLLIRECCKASALTEIESSFLFTSVLYFFLFSKSFYYYYLYTPYGCVCICVCIYLHTLISFYFFLLDSRFF